MPDAGRAFWDRSAGRYDLSMRLLGGPIGPMCARVAEEVRGRERVLEVAAGTGLVTQAVAPEVGSLVATDYSEAMVAQVRERVLAGGLDNVTVDVLDVFALEDNDGFDAIVATNVLHLLADVDAAMERMGNALRQGGLLVVPTYCHDQTMLARVVSVGLGLAGFPGQRRLDLASLERLVRQHGLKLQTVEILSGLIPIGYVSASRSP